MAEPRLSTVGTEKTADHDVAHVAVKPLNDIKVAVDWQVLVPASWKSTTDLEKKNTFITDYRLSEVKGEDYKYKLEYKTSYTREYDFIDAAGHAHRSEGQPRITNKVSYNSDKPAIEAIQL